jgi:hypothetical protein
MNRRDIIKGTTAALSGAVIGGSIVVVGPSETSLSDSALYEAITDYHAIADQADALQERQSRIHKSVEANHPERERAHALLRELCDVEGEPDRAALAAVHKSLDGLNPPFNADLERAGGLAGEAISQVARDRAWDAYWAALEIPAYTAEGLNAKLSMLLRENRAAADCLEGRCCTWRHPDDLEAALIRVEWVALVSDIRRLAGVS